MLVVIGSLSQGRVKTLPTATPNRFADVAPLFFFPLMSSYDCPQGTPPHTSHTLTTHTLYRYVGLARTGQSVAR